MSTGARDDEARAAAADAIVAAYPQDGLTLEALLRDTLVVTMSDSGVKPNVIPSQAEAVVNARLLPGTSVEKFILDLKDVIDDPQVRIEIVNARPKEGGITPAAGGLSLDHASHLDGSRVRRRALDLAATLETHIGAAPARPSNRAERHTVALRGLLLAQLVQLLLRAATEYPVEVVDVKFMDGIRKADRWRVRVRARSDAQHAALCRALEIHRPLARRLHDALIEQPVMLSDAWYWVGNEGEEGGEAELSFERAHDGAERLYVFHSDARIEARARGALINLHGGRADQQLRRQMRAWRTLRRYPALLDILLSPSLSRSSSSTAVLDDENFTSPIRTSSGRCGRRSPPSDCRSRTVRLA